MKIWFDMDGTIADFYSVFGWLEMLEAQQVAPYERAKPLVRMATFARRINTLKAQGYEVGIISWGSKNATEEYLSRIEIAKKEWLRKHCPSIHWDEICVVPYGTPKHLVCKNGGILFDDEARNRDGWSRNFAGIAYDETQIFDVLKELKPLDIIAKENEHRTARMKNKNTWRLHRYIR